MLEFEEYLEDLTGQIFGLVEAFWVFAEGFLNIESVVVCDLEGEVAGLPIDFWIAGHADTFGIVENDGGVVVGDAGVEPGEAAAGEFDLGEGIGLDGCFRGGDVALELTPDFSNVFFETGHECGEEELALSG